MEFEMESLTKCREIVDKMAHGLNPFTEEFMENESVVQDPRIIRCMFMLNDVLGSVLNGGTRALYRRPADFIITSEQKQEVKFPMHKVGINEFAKCVNKVVDENLSKKLHGAFINRQLKRMGILGELEDKGGRTKTVLNDKSDEFGIETEKKVFNGNEYEKILFNDFGKRFLLENIEKIVGFKEETQEAVLN